MRGFAATPLVFVAVFLITALLFLHFLDIDKRAAEGIGKESRLLKLQADSMKQQASNASKISSVAYVYAQRGWSLSKMGDELNKYFNISIDVYDPVPNDNYFSMSWPFSWNDTLIDASLSSNRTVQTDVANTSWNG